jgi:hypothetical protein
MQIEEAAAMNAIVAVAWKHGESVALGPHFSLFGFTPALQRISWVTNLAYAVGA